MSYESGEMQIIINAVVICGNCFSKINGANCICNNEDGYDGQYEITVPVCKHCFNKAVYEEYRRRHGGEK